MMRDLSEWLEGTMCSRELEMVEGRLGPLAEDALFIQYESNVRLMNYKNYQQATVVCNQSKPIISP